MKITIKVKTTSRLSLLISVVAQLWATAVPSDSVVVFNEVMYHPADNDTSGEWVELYNQMAVDIDLSGWRLSGGIDFTFPAGTVIDGGGFLVIAANPAAISGSLGPFERALNNAGETLNLRNNSNRLMDSLTYEDNWPWPPAADGGGGSLVKNSPLKPTGDPRSWRGSLAKGGTPGSVENFSSQPSLQISEVAAGGGTGFFVELQNTGSTAVELLGVGIASSSGTGKHTFSSQSLAAGEFLEINSTTLGFTPAIGERLFLTGPGSSQIYDAAVLTDTAQARRAGDSAQQRFCTPDVPTPGSANSFDFKDAIVINEIMYHARPTFPSAGTPPSYLDELIVANDATWRYQQSGAFPGVNWMTAAFDESTWSTGQAVLGVESAELPEPIRTNLTLGVITYYFRHSFNYSGNPDADLLRLRLLIDDGAVIYLNGSEVLRNGMGEGLIDQNTLATPGVSNATFQTIDLPENALMVGENLIAVEVHQSSSGSSDLVFGMEVVSRTLTDPGIPAVDFTESKEEWLELYNRSDATISLNGWTLAGGLDFDFPFGTNIAPGGYLVIAGDLPTFNATHPSVAALGEYSGGLGNGADQIILLDEKGNPADEIGYFDGGRWDSHADGSGPSLELIHPDTDNSQGEAWQASDEAAKSTWKTYTYRAIADSPVSGDPTIWQELALGLLDGEGEVLLDDISVKQSPDGAATERLQNGAFSGNSDDHWRFLGNHQRSFVESNTLHLIASGATEYQGNQVETTFGSGASIVNGAEYEISFRARWLSGSSQLNTRLYFNRAAKTTLLEVPTNNGTPGAPNSRLVTNAPPTFETLSHLPLLPAASQAVSISAHLSDPDGIASAILHYRPDGSSWESVPMTLGGENFSAQVPGQNAGKVVQFYVAATDSLGATSTYPKAGPDSRALFEVNDGVTANGAVHDLRATMLTADSDHLHLATNSLSNELLGATVIYQGEPFYDVGIRLKGSFVGRDAARVGFNIKFNPDQLFRGIHDKVAVDRSTHGDLGIDEVLIKHIATSAGDIPGMYDDIVQFIAPRSEHNRRALLRIAAFDDIYLDSQFEKGSDGTVYEFEVYRWATTTIDGNPESPKRAGGLGAPNGFRNVPFADYGDEKEDYRWHCLITSNRTRDDYSDIIPFLQAFSQNGAALEAVAPEVMDVDAVMRTLAYQTLVGPGDSTFTGGADHNFRLYARPDGKVLYLPWDWDSAFQRATNASLVGGGRLAALVNRPAHLRLFQGHLRDIIGKSFNSSYMSSWASHFGSLGGQNFNNRVSYINARANFVSGQLPAQIPFEITTNGGKNYSVFTSTAAVSGEGWIDVAEIRTGVDRSPLEVTWTGSDTWMVNLPLGVGANEMTLFAYDRDGGQVGSDTITISNLSSIEAAGPGNLVLSEIMYHPEDGSEEFVELQNIGDSTIDLSGVHFSDGIDYTFPNGTQLESGERFVIYESQFLKATGLKNSGEQITLLAGDGGIIRDFAYKDKLPWPTAPEGDGFSLVLINPVSNPDHALPENWRPSTAPGGNPNATDATTFPGGDLFAYVSGANPTLNINGTSPTLAYFKNLAADDVTLRAQWSTDLITWNELGDDFTLTSRTAVIGAREHFEFTSNLPLGSRFFIRLVAEQ